MVLVLIRLTCAYIFIIWLYPKISCFLCLLLWFGYELNTVHDAFLIHVYIMNTHIMPDNSVRGFAFLKSIDFTNMTKKNSKFQCVTMEGWTPILYWVSTFPVFCK